VITESIESATAFVVRTNATFGQLYRVEQMVPGSNIDCAGMYCFTAGGLNP